MAFDDQLRVSLANAANVELSKYSLCSGYTYRTGAEVGIAWMSQVCNTGAIRSSSTGEYTSGTGVSSISK